MKEVGEKTLIRGKLAEAETSPFKAYMDLTVGNVGFMRFFIYELLTSLLGPMPGGAGFYLRKKFYSTLLMKSGEGLIMGRNVVIRHPDKIKLGHNITIDDNCLIDARGAGPSGIVLEDNVIINRNCMIQAKAGPIRLGKRTSIGSNSVIVSMDGVELGESVLVAGNCSLSAGSYHFDEAESAIMDQGAYSKGPIRVGSRSWLGTGVIILDGVTVGSGSVIGAGAVVTKDVPGKVIVAGIPARIMRKLE